ncbi:MAG: polysaccharide biosynthesis protein [Lachnospiraceae bacterium]|nr:polysaccharide biosynthesis protein [Lachnospiraceae bacterium]
MDKKKKSGFMVQGGILAAAGLITRFIGLLYRIPLTRTVGKEGMGYYNTAYEIYNIALLISCYSVPVAVSKLIADKEGKGEYVNSSRYFRFALILSSSIGLTVSLLVFIFAPQIAVAYKYPNCMIPLRVLCPTIFVFSIMGVIRGFFQGKRTMVPTAVSQIIEQIVNAVVSVVAAAYLINAFKDLSESAAYGAAGGTAGTLAGAFAALIFLVILLFLYKKKADKSELIDNTGNKDEAKVILKALIFTMMPIIFSQTIYQVSGTIDSYMFSNMMSKQGYTESERAIFWEAYSNRYKWMYNVPVAIASAFGVTIVPALSASHAVHDTEGIKKQIASAVKFNMLIAFPAAAGLGFLSEPILVLLLGDVTDNLGPRLLSLGCMAVVFFALSTLTNGVLQGINLMRKPVIHSAVALVIHIVAVYLGLNIFPREDGTYIMVICNMLYGLLVCAMNWYSIGKTLNYKQEIKRTFILPAICAAAMGALASLMYELLFGYTHSRLVALVPTIFAAIMIYAVLIILTKTVTEEELKTMPKGRTIVSLLKKLRLLR